MTAIGLLVVLGLELGFRPLPERARGIDLARVALRAGELDRKQDVVGVGADDALDLERLEIALGVRSSDAGRSRCRAGRARPAPRVAGAISKPAPPDELHTQASLEPARRLITSMRSATMKAE